MEVRRVKPGVREEFVVIRKFFAKTAQMNTKSVFTSYVVHSQKVVDSLERLHI